MEQTLNRHRNQYQHKSVYYLLQILTAYCLLPTAYCGLRTEYCRLEFFFQPHTTKTPTILSYPKICDD